MKLRGKTILSHRCARGFCGAARGGIAIVRDSLLWITVLANITSIYIFFSFYIISAAAESSFDVSY